MDPFDIDCEMNFFCYIDKTITNKSLDNGKYWFIII